MTTFGIYDDFTYDQTHPRLFPTAPERLTAIRAAGIGVVLNYGTGAMGLADLGRYADEAQAAGVRVIWNPWDQPDHWRDDVFLMAKHPATWGFYAGDEAAPGSLEATRVFAAGKRAAHVGRPSLYISRPGRKVMRPFLSAATHVGPDCYPIGSPPWWDKPEPQQIGDVAAWARELVDLPGGASKLAFACQCFAWGALLGEAREGDPVIWPTPDQMGAMKRAVLRRGHPELLLWFCMHAITDRHPDPAAYWRGFASVAA